MKTTYFFCPQSHVWRKKIKNKNGVFGLKHALCKFKKLKLQYQQTQFVTKEYAKSKDWGPKQKKPISCATENLQRKL